MCYYVLYIEIYSQSRYAYRMGCGDSRLSEYIVVVRIRFKSQLDLYKRCGSKKKDIYKR